MDSAVRNLGRAVLISALCAILQGCAQMKAYAEPADCKGCHVTTLAPRAPDFSAIYANPSTHHPFGITYPQHGSNFNPPTQQRGNVYFFDRNGNGQPDNDEIALFEKAGILKVECASCHRPHGVAGLDDPFPGPQLKASDSYLRTHQSQGDFCIICHNK